MSTDKFQSVGVRSAWSSIIPDVAYFNENPDIPYMQYLRDLQPFMHERQAD